MRNLKKILAVMLLVALAVSMTACASEEKPEAALDKFCAGYNALDINKVLDSLDPAVAAPYKALMKLGSKLLGVEINDLVQLLPLADLIDPSMNISGTQPKISYVLNSKTIEGNTAILNVTLTVKAGSQVQTTTDYMKMIKVDGTWYISMDSVDGSYGGGGGGAYGGGGAGSR